jgi:polyhydroxyalkanoate synthesis regulator phasin
MAEDEIDALMKVLVRNKELSKSEAGRLKKEILGFTDSLKSWISDTIDRRLGEVLDAMKLARKEEVADLRKRLGHLEERLDRYEKLHGQKPGIGN